MNGTLKKLLGLALILPAPLVWAQDQGYEPPATDYSGETAREEGSDSDSNRPQRPVADVKLPDDVSFCARDDYYTARNVASPRLAEAVTYLGGAFANVTREKKNEKAATLLTRLLNAAPAQSSGSGGPYGSMSSRGSMPMGPRGSAPMGSMPGSGGEAPKAPDKPLDAVSVAAIVDALSVNGSRPARQTIFKVLAGTQTTDNEAAAVDAALASLLTHATPESEELLMTILVTPEKVRPRAPGESAQASGSQSGSYSRGSMGSMSQPYGPGSSSPRKMTTSELQNKAMAAVGQHGSDEFRLKIAKQFTDAKTTAELRTALGGVLLVSHPRNVAAQAVLHASANVDKEFKAQIERQFVQYSSGALATLLNVPFEPTAAPAPKRGSPGSGASGSYSGSMPPGRSGSMPPSRSGSGDSRSGSMPPTMSGSGDSMSGYTPPETSEESTRNEEEEGSRRSGSYSGSRPPSMSGSYPGSMPPGSMPPGANGAGTAGGGMFGAALAADPETPYRLARHLWSESFATGMVAGLDTVDSLQRNAQRVLLASTIPSDVVRAKLYQTLRKHWDDGPQGLEEAGMGYGVFSDPGFLVVLKALPRKDAPAQEITAKAARARRRGRSGSSRSSGSGFGSSGSNPNYESESGSAPGSSAAAKEPEKPEYAWMGATEDYVRALCEQLERAGKSGRGKIAAESRPVEIPVPEESIQAEYQFQWPNDLASGRNRLRGVSLDPMRVYYIRIRTKSAPLKILGYYKRKLARPVEHSSGGNYWLESTRPVEDSDRRLSVDMLVTKEDRDGSGNARPSGGSGSSGAPSSGGRSSPARAAAIKAAAEKAEKEAVSELMVEIVAVEIKSPVSAEEESKAPKKDAWSSGVE